MINAVAAIAAIAGIAGTDAIAAIAAIAANEKATIHHTGSMQQNTCVWVLRLT